METLIYGLAPDETRDYMESLLSTNCKNENDVQKVISAAKAAGYHSFRITSYNGEKPNFANTLNI
jgi:hypothetical protein